MIGDGIYYEYVMQYRSNEQSRLIRNFLNHERGKYRAKDPTSFTSSVAILQHTIREGN